MGILAYYGYSEANLASATLTGKGRITIPDTVRNALGMKAGDRVEFVEAAPGRYELIGITRSITALKGMFGKPSRTVSVEDMNPALARRGSAK